MERDYDRILFSTPVRRLADKTQVFPLEQHDAVHTRLTHSHEVSTLARAMGLDLVARFSGQLGILDDLDHARDVSALMAAAGLVHDFGNPPFGHQGEAAIQRWFAANEESVLAGEKGLPDEMRADFLNFEGNAQTFRLVTRLQLQGDSFGLNLTYGTLATLLKYTSSASEADKESKAAGRKKPGFFRSEGKIVEEVWNATGLEAGQRHPLAYLVEACDDIAYSVIDVEDAVRKDLSSFEDIRAHLRGAELPEGSRALATRVVDNATKRREDLLSRAKGSNSYTPAELDDLSMQWFRVVAISEMVQAVLDTFVARWPEISKGTFAGDLLDASPAGPFRSSLKDFLEVTVFPHRSVLEIELTGSLVISELMDRLWGAILASTSSEGKADPLSAYTFSRISENYRRVFRQSVGELPLRYCQAQLLADMVAGMTDSFALSLLEDLRRF